MKDMPAYQVGRRHFLKEDRRSSFVLVPYDSAPSKYVAETQLLKSILFAGRRFISD
jgi:hypothetical protein